MNAANDASASSIFMAIADYAPGDDTPLVVTETMRNACQSQSGAILHDMKPTFHPLAIPNWRDCLTCYRCGYTLVTQRMYEQAPHWAKVYLAALYLEDWLELLEELPEETDGDTSLH